MIFRDNIIVFRKWVDLPVKSVNFFVHPTPCHTLTATDMITTLIVFIYKVKLLGICTNIYIRNSNLFFVVFHEKNISTDSICPRPLLLCNSICNDVDLFLCFANVLGWIRSMYIFKLPSHHIIFIRAYYIIFNYTYRFKRSIVYYFMFGCSDYYPILCCVLKARF